MERTWTIEGQPGAYTGTTESPESTVSFDAVSLKGNMLTVVFPSRSGRGAMEMTVVIEGDQLTGSAELGPRTIKVTGSRVSRPEGGAQ